MILSSGTMDFCFRIRFQLGPRLRINSPDRHLLLASDDRDEGIQLRPTEDVAVKDARDLVLLGRRYDTEADATEAATRWRGLLQKAFARVNIGADFGDRAPKSFLTRAGIAMVEDQTGRRVLNDVHGTSVFECEPQPLFTAFSATYRKEVQADRLTNAVAVAVEHGAVMSARDQLAYDLYSASMFVEPSADARLAMLMMALETMIDPQPRTDAVREHVDQLIADTQASDLPSNEISSIVSHLEWLYNESIGRAGRRLASRVGDRRYMDEPPDRFFTNCYTLRSDLIHGRDPRPPAPEVGSRAASLELLVRDLLSIELLDKLPD